MVDNPLIKLDRRDGQALLTINRPKVLNALNRQTLERLDEALDTVRDDPQIQALVITGAGDRAFVAGADIEELKNLDAVKASQFAARGQEIFNRIERFPKPVIAAVNGYCLGGGCELAISCHLRVASTGAKFGQPEVKLGIIPGYGGTQRLPRLIGSGPALEMILTGDPIDAAEALRLGLVNRVVAPEDLIETCRSIAASIGRNGPLAVRWALQAVREGGQMPLAQGLSLESSLFGLCCSTDDQKEGARAFLEKRAARFRGV